jgi:hypothetical protein
MSKLSPTLESVWRTFTRSAELVRIFNSTTKTRMVDREKYVVCKLDEPTACILGFDAAH